MRAYLTLILTVFLAGACGGGPAEQPTLTGPSQVQSSVPAAQPKPSPSSQSSTYDVDSLGVPQFITENYIDLSRIRRVSRFRSGEGHSYTDTFEACRSMKHYFQTPTDSSAADVRILAPVTGEVIRMDAEWAGTQVHIMPDGQQAFRVILFHVATEGIAVGSRVEAGQTIGHHVGSQTMSDVAVAVDTPGGFKLVSWFDAITDRVLETYRARGLGSRGDAIITREARDASPLSCNGEAFNGKGSLENWIDFR